jgi:radical SAM superfamily enzyme YgiQ (UPF0313 family)
VTLDKLKRAGFNWLCFGYEAANANVRSGVDKSYKQDEIYTVTERVRKAGIAILANFIFGLPDDDRASMQATLDLATDLNCEFANFYSAMAYPGSGLYAQALARGWTLPESWIGFSQHAYETLPLPTNHVSAADVLRFRDEAFQAYYRNPAYLNMVERKFGPDTVAHVRAMVEHPLRRKALERVPA